MARARVVIRADAGAAIGMGHVVRCLALARELGERGAEVSLASKALPPVLDESAQRLGVVVLPLQAGADAETSAQALRRLAPVDLLIVDHYELDMQWEQAVRPLAAKLIALDDLPRAHRCDVILNQNYSSAAEQRYEGLVGPTTALLLGPGYALVRREFQVARARRAAGVGDGPVILVSFGGFDAPLLVELALEACALAPLAGRLRDGTLHIFGAQAPSRSGDGYPFKVCWHQFSNDIATYMAVSDVAIGAGGGALWERLCVGLPSLVTIMAENQRPGVEALAADGYVESLGAAEQLDAARLCSCLSQLLSDHARRQHMSEQGKRLVDGDGARRVASILLT